MASPQLRRLARPATLLRPTILQARSSRAPAVCGRSAIYALDDLLPAPIGGSPGNVQEQRGTSLITQFRADQLIAARDDINEAIPDSLGVGTNGTTVTTKAPSTPRHASAPASQRLVCAQHKRCDSTARAGGRRARTAGRVRDR